MATRIILSSMAALAVLSATPAFAGEWRTKEVRIADLDLTSEAGQKRVYSRIERAIKTVCRSHGARPLSERKDIQQCETNARTAAMANVKEHIAQQQAKRALALKE
jgi:UrcA family protein